VTLGSHYIFEYPCLEVVPPVIIISDLAYAQLLG